MEEEVSAELSDQYCKVLRFINDIPPPFGLIINQWIYSKRSHLSSEHLFINNSRTDDARNLGSLVSGEDIIVDKLTVLKKSP